MSAAPRLLAVDARCPRCGAPPRVRISALQQQKWEGEPTAALAHTYQCHRNLRDGRKCNAIYPITAGAIQRASGA